jgi:hypothetical protein
LAVATGLHAAGASAQLFDFLIDPWRDAGSASELLDMLPLVAPDGGDER